MDKVCTCNNEFIDRECVICKSLFPITGTELEKKRSCPYHQQILICGHTEFICETCKKFGWRSTAGTGGGWFHINDRTGESINMYKKLKMYNNSNSPLF